jgi:hypothetical protein
MSRLFDIYRGLGRQERILECAHEFEKFSDENDKKAFAEKLKLLRNASSIQ